MKNSELKPCPFCGAEPLLSEIEPHAHFLAIGGVTFPDHPGSWTIECPSCECGMIADTREAVTTAWNRRTTPPAGELPALPWEGPENGNDFEAWLEARDRFDIQAAFRAYARQAIAAQGAVTAGALDDDEDLKGNIDFAISLIKRGNGALCDGAITWLQGLQRYIIGRCNKSYGAGFYDGRDVGRAEGSPAVAQPVADERDAQRYRWLKSQCGQEHHSLLTVQHELDGIVSGGDLDATIDAARAALCQPADEGRKL